MKTLGNIIWIVFGGAVTAIEYVVASIGLMVTIIGIPFGLQSLKLAELELWPFKKTVFRLHFVYYEYYLVFCRRIAHCSHSLALRCSFLYYDYRNTFWQSAL